ncbi:MAG TPA: helix-turn-helix domain-containing protein [Paenibacillus sp.]|nr:helix-turn-helix domain-containing protein [Paenibacillus sp.]
MYRLLIVDDEPYVADGLYDVFQDATQFELDLHCAYNGFDAIGKLERYKFDIVITDIRMPGMSGIELHRTILERWPSCKVVFLTGYDDFAYIQQTVRRGEVIDYVLKTEEDDVVLEAVRKAIASIEESRSSETYLSKARASYHEALPLLRSKFLMRVLNGRGTTAEWRRKQCADLRLELDPDAPVTVIGCRIDGWPETHDEKDMELLHYAAVNIASEQLSALGTFAGTEMDSSFLSMWFFQSFHSSSKSTSAQLLGILENVQSVCMDYLKLPLSIVVSEDPANWAALSNSYVSIRDEFMFGRGRGRVMALIRRSDEAVEGEGLSRPSAGAASKPMRTGLSQIGQLGVYLEQGREDDFHDLLKHITELAQEANPLHQIEAFLTIGAMFAAFLNRAELVLHEKVDFEKLTNFSAHSSWAEINRYFKHIATLVFTRLRSDTTDWNRQVIERLQRHIAENMSGDLTLGRLAELVHLNPFYLSRLYKLRTGTTISDYVTAARMEAARELLLGSNLKIHEIAERVGYENSTYFTRVFKKKHKSTPQEYRDQTAYKS